MRHYETILMCGWPNFIRQFLLLFGAILLVACSDGGGGVSGPGPNTPSFSSPSSVTITENTQSPIYTAVASDSDGDSVSYSISGGVDASLFTINSTNGQLTANQELIFESRLDDNADNTFVVQISASDGSNSQSITLEITLLNQLFGGFLSFFGDNAGDAIGYNVSFLPDIDGDGVSEIVFGKANTESTEIDDTFGYVVLSSSIDNDLDSNIDLDEIAGPLGVKIVVSDLQSAPSTLIGGFSIQPAGDVNNDGVGDILVLAPGALNTTDLVPSNFEITLPETSAFLIFGNASSFASADSIDISQLTAQIVRIILPDDYAVGLSGYVPSTVQLTESGGAGDINDDGYDDVIIGVRNAAGPAFDTGLLVLDGMALTTKLSGDQIFSLSAGGLGTNHLFIKPSEMQFSLRTNANSAAFSVSEDFTGDGIDDILAAGSFGSLLVSGASVSGDSDGFFEAADQLGVGETVLFQNPVDPFNISTRLISKSVGSIRDIGNDGLDEAVLIMDRERVPDIDGVPLADQVNTVYVIDSAYFNNPVNLSSGEIILSTSALPGGLKIIPSIDSVEFIADIGDLDGDGNNEILLAGGGVLDSGSSSVGIFSAEIIFGDVISGSRGQALDLRDRAQANSFRILFDVVDENLLFVDNRDTAIGSSAADLDNDGVNDIIIGLPSALTVPPDGRTLSPFVDERGAVYVISGRTIIDLVASGQDEITIN